MDDRPPSAASLAALRKLRTQCTTNGDHKLAVLLAGLELYVSLGCEFELLQEMRTFAHRMKGPVEGTPTADDLSRLWRLPGPPEA